jgi:ribosomal protein S18 acetylase RimI-like enzyme
VDIEVGPARPEERDAVVAVFTAAQRRRDRHICYLAVEPDAIAAELDGLEPHAWDGVLVARSPEGAVVGALAAEHDTEPPRVWWHGPVIAEEPSLDFLEVGGALLEAARARLPDHVVEEELAGDEAHLELAALASRYGFETAPASAVLHRASSPPPQVPEAATIRPFAEPDRGVVAAIHDDAFPNTHTPGHRVDEGEDRWVLVADRDGEVVGYVAAERHEDGSGYIDLVGVRRDVRGAGVGAALVAASIATLADVGCEAVNLTVRESLHGARRLYERLGFTEERLVRPHRRGFRLP